jgi:hypothetical protein
MKKALDSYFGGSGSGLSSLGGLGGVGLGPSSSGMQGGSGSTEIGNIGSTGFSSSFASNKVTSFGGNSSGFGTGGGPVRA